MATHHPFSSDALAVPENIHVELENQKDDKKRDDDDDNDDDPSDDPDNEPSEEMMREMRGITIYVRKTFDVQQTKAFYVMPSWKLFSLRYLVFHKFRVPPFFQRFRTIGGDDLHFNLTFAENGLTDNQEILLTLTLDGGVKRTIVKERDETKILRLKQRIRSDVREVDEDEVEALVATLAEAKGYLGDENFTVQSLLGDASLETLKEVLELAPIGVNGRASNAKMTSIIHKLVPCLQKLQEGLTTCKDLYQHIYHAFMTQYADEFNKMTGNDAQLCHQSFRTAVQGLMDLKGRIEKQEVKNETKKEYDEILKAEVARIRQEEAEKASVLARQMAQDFIKQQQSDAKASGGTDVEMSG